ncbi:pentatricopeptide repeat-containing protein At1g10270 isoform X2 [Prosopis cineraria]|uniref:pentatricopeptide repeat-containing protein At1g10270 isoform X2 n=1 Tax=Prosopis cineraria TaxID=364024 RepID=UPI00240F5A9F|nr:pentatricopeptide repeat-containing protein At1g10270 isoform X2 [Prosopis cineraria]
MSLYRLLIRSLRRFSTSELASQNHLHHTQCVNFETNINPFQISQSRAFAFSSAEEAAAERRRRKRRLRIEPPLNAIRPPPQQSFSRDPNAPRLPDSTSALVGPRLSLHNRVQSLIRAGDLDAASAVARHSVFSRTRPTVFTCNAIIAAMYRAKRYNDAVSLFQFFFNQSNIVPNIVSYNNLINTHCDEGRVDVGLEVYRHIMANAPFSPSPVTYRHLTKGLIDAGRIGEAVDLLREMLNKGHGADSLVYNNLISGFLNLGNLEKANELFDELKERCLVYDGVVNATYMEWFFNQGRDKEAMESYKSLMDRQFRMIPATCNVLLEVLLRHGREKEAWALFDQMLDNHTPPNFQAVNSDTFNIMVNECFKLGKISEALSTFKKVGTRANSKPFAMDVAGYNNIISRCCENGMLSEAETLFEELCSKSLSPDVPTHRTLIEAYLKMERIDDALRVFNRMVDAGLRVVASFGNRVFDELIKNGKAIDSAQILSKMGEKDPKPEPSCYEVVIMGLCGEGLLDKGRDLLDEVMRYGVGVTPALKEFVTEVFGKAGRGEEIERLLGMNRWAHNPRPSGPRPPYRPPPPPAAKYPPQMTGPQNQSSVPPSQMRGQMHPTQPAQMTGTHQPSWGASHHMMGPYMPASGIPPHPAGPPSAPPSPMMGQQQEPQPQMIGQHYPSSGEQVQTSPPYYAPSGQHYPRSGEAAQISPSNHSVSGPSVDAVRPYQPPSEFPPHVEESSQQQLQVPQRMAA